MKKIIILVLVCLNSINYGFSQSEFEKPFANPFMIYGSTFGNYFKALYKTGDYKTMMKFTSSESLKKFGYNKIFNYYKEMDFRYDMTLKASTNPQKVVNKKYLLTYESSIQNTKMTTKMEVVVENDSCKLVLDNLIFNLGIREEEIFGKKNKTQQ